MAHITEDGPTTLTLVSLQGHPMMRAVLYEALQISSSQDVLREMFRTLESTEVVIALHLGDGALITLNDDAFRWNHNRLDIYMRKGQREFSRRGFNGATGLSLGYTLPDEKAELAKEQDESDLSRLKESPAYLSALTFRKL